MSQQQGGGLGCLGVILLLVVLGLAIEYWYIVVGIIVLLVVGFFVFSSLAASDQRQLQEKQDRIAARKEQNQQEAERRERADKLQRITDRFTALEARSASQIHHLTTEPENAGWLVDSNPHVQAFRSQYHRARTEFSRRLKPYSSMYPPREDQLTQLDEMVTDLEVAYDHADRGVRLFGWGGPAPDSTDLAAAARYAAEAQRVLDSRWNQPALIDPPGPFSVTRYGKLVHEAITRHWPVLRESVHDIMAVADSAVVRPHVPRDTDDALDTQLATGLLVEDHNGALWPAWVDPDEWICHRTFPNDHHPDYLPLVQAPIREIANAHWATLAEETEAGGMPVDQLIEATLRRLRGPDAAPDNSPRLQARLRRGLDDALLSDRVQRESDGRITLLRVTWPATYRRSRFDERG
ncbi:hypothetical protein [Auritidibacter sp. NML120636]|uniref:hypothetical protein n=1 Tax=Auritidibacter sp. NML120636 TaxID=2170743 RepID=UPI000D7286A0|nr:hypothetical protein [Auritidibacter sp. NML120636]PXA82103.1 hypothetical protein DCC25_01695 [Auritidibacter sp. NML120636]